jgi:hypothetical protein
MEDALTLYIFFGIIIVGLLLYIGTSIAGVLKSKSEIDNLVK